MLRASRTTGTFRTRSLLGRSFAERAMASGRLVARGGLLSCYYSVHRLLANRQDGRLLAPAGSMLPTERTAVRRTVSSLPNLSREHFGCSPAAANKALLLELPGDAVERAPLPSQARAYRQAIARALQALPQVSAWPLSLPSQQREYRKATTTLFEELPRVAAEATPLPSQHREYTKAVVSAFAELPRAAAEAAPLPPQGRLYRQSVVAGFAQLPHLVTAGLSRRGSMREAAAGFAALPGQVSDFEAGCSAATAFKQLALLQETGTHPHASYDDREMHGLVPGPQGIVVREVGCEPTQPFTPQSQLEEDGVSFYVPEESHSQLRGKGGDVLGRVSVYVHQGNRAQVSVAIDEATMGVDTAQEALREVFGPQHQGPVPFIHALQQKGFFNQEQLDLLEDLALDVHFFCAQFACSQWEMRQRQFRVADPLPEGFTGIASCALLELDLPRPACATLSGCEVVQ